MAITTDGRESIAVVLGASGTTPTHFAIGSGDTAFNITDTALAKEYDRNEITTTDLSVGQNTTFIANFSSTEISGTVFREFGMLNNAAGGNLYHREVLIGSLSFEGDRELQLQTTYKVT